MTAFTFCFQLPPPKILKDPSLSFHVLHRLMYLVNTAEQIKTSLSYRKAKRVNQNLFVQKCKPLKCVKINEKGQKKHYSSPI